MKNSIKTTIIFSVISVMSATSVMIIYSINRKKVTNTYSMHRNEEAERSESSGCSYVDFIGDQVCDDEANTEECQFDLGDCCDVQNDFTLCSDCFCYSSGHLNNSLIQDCPSKSGLELHLKNHIGDGKCQLELNNLAHFFDGGDCCLDDPECSITIQGEGDLWCHQSNLCSDPHYESFEVVCPEHVCIQSDIHCIQELMGDGICHDNNNSKLCEWDLGDCCKSNLNRDDCCICACLPATPGSIQHF